MPHGSLVCGSRAATGHTVEVVGRPIGDAAGDRNHHGRVVTNRVQESATANIRDAGKEDQFGRISSIQRKFDDALIHLLPVPSLGSGVDIKKTRLQKGASISTLLGESPSGKVIKEGKDQMRKILTIVFSWSFALTCILAALPAFAESDLTIFGAAQRQGKLTLQGTFLDQANATQTITSNMNPLTFGVFGIRYGHGKVIGSEHTLAYAPNFIESSGSAFFYHSNLRVQAPFPVITPYGTAGLGSIFTWAKSQPGTAPGVVSPADIGTKLAINYGGGVKVFAKGRAGVQFDIRGYTLPSVSFNLPVPGQTVKTSNQSLNFVQYGLGVVFKFGE